MEQLTRENIIDKIVECGKVLDEADRKYRTCPDCGRFPVERWALIGPPGLTWRECPKCAWTDRPVDVDVM